MERRKRRKMCPLCDGELDLEVKFCPYCGNDFSENAEIEEEYEPQSTMTANETIASLYPPPYQPQKKSSAVFLEEERNEEEEDFEEEEEEEVEKSEKKHFFPTMLFFLGMNLLVLSLMLFFFSKNGELILKWNSSYALAYLCVALPLIIIGYKGLSKIE